MTLIERGEVAVDEVVLRLAVELQAGAGFEVAALQRLQLFASGALRRCGRRGFGGDLLGARRSLDHRERPGRQDAVALDVERLAVELEAVEVGLGRVGLGEDVDCLAVDDDAVLRGFVLLDVVGHLIVLADADGESCGVVRVSELHVLRDLSVSLPFQFCWPHQHVAISTLLYYTKKIRLYTTFLSFFKLFFRAARHIRAALRVT